MEIRKKKLIEYFAVTLLALVVCVQVVTAPPTPHPQPPTNDQLQAEITAMQTQINTQNAKITTLNNTVTILTGQNNNLMTQLTNLQTSVSAIKPGSQVIVQTGTVYDGATIPIPAGYTINQCKVILDLGTNATSYGVIYAYDPLCEPSEYSVVTSIAQPNTNNDGFVIHAFTKFIGTNNNVFYDHNQVGYMLIATK